MDFFALAAQCAPQLEQAVVSAIADTESNFNPFAIGVVDGYVKPARSWQQAMAQVKKLGNKNFSVGLMQVNKSNFAKYGLTNTNLFDSCTNVRVGATIFADCLKSARNNYPGQSYYGHLRLAASCYYSGNFKTGFKADFIGQPPYVTKFWNNYLAYAKSSTFAPTLGTATNVKSLPKSPQALAEFTQNLQNKDSLPLGEVVDDNSTKNPKRLKQGLVGLFASTTPDLFSKPNQLMR